MEPDPPPHPSRGGEWFPHIIYHDVQDDGTVLVTWALPNLTNAVVRVPLSEWMDGHHYRTGTFLASFTPTPRPPRPGKETEAETDPTG